jgi:protein-S-isoprenylcysteine O-methyltransferase Ste14
MNTNDHVLQYRPPRIAAGLVVVALLMHWAQPIEIHRALPAAAGIVGATGMLIMLRAWWLFRQWATAICPTERTTTLIIQDVYRLSRNPMYVGITLLLFAASLFAGSLALYLATVVNFAILSRHFVPYEERQLERQFGACYRNYASRVRRWI